MADLPFLMHECHGKVSREETVGDLWCQWRVCEECGIEWCASMVNLSAIAKLKLEEGNNV
jgi:hypothetical protein